MLRLTLEMILSTNLTKIATWLAQNFTIFYLRQQSCLLIHTDNCSGSWSVILQGFLQNEVISSLRTFEAKNLHFKLAIFLYLSELSFYSSI